MPASQNLTQHFQAALEAGDRALGWTVARVPFAPHTIWPERHRLRVQGTLNGHPFRSSLFPDPAHPGRFFLLINRTLQAAAHVRLGETGTFTLEPDLAPRPADLPEELDALLDEAEGLRAWYTALSESTRREIGKWLLAVKGPEARLRRAQHMAERLLSTMEAETALPPLIEQAFRARPRARTGWARMTPHQRRAELFGLFYYRSPESQAKRLSKLCDTAELHAP